MTVNELNIFIEEGEGYKIEFKESLSNLSKELVAFANSSGGRVFLGVNDKGKIIGYELNNKIKSQIQDIANNCDPPVNIQIEKYQNIVIINIKEGLDKPYRCSEGFFLRVGANSQKMNRNDIIAFIQNEGKIRFDELFNDKFNFKSDFDNNSFFHFLKLCGISRSYKAIDVLKNLDLIKQENNKHSLNNAGILFFAKNPENFIIQSKVTCVLYKGIEKVNILDRKDFNSDIISNVEDSITFLKKHLNLSYTIKSIQREESLEIPETALREAVVNSVIHRDYFEKGANVKIEIFDDRLVITNPGGLPKGLDPSEFGRISVTRNPILASLMLRAGYIEMLGTGINRIQMALKNLKLPKAEFNYNNFFTVIFKRIVSINIEKNKEFYSEIFPKNFALNFALKGKRLDRIIKILESIYTDKFTTGEEFAKNIDVSDRTIDIDLAFLKKIEYIEYIGPLKTGKYYLSEKAIKKIKNTKRNKN